jgi:hypothetical protein
MTKTMLILSNSETDLQSCLKVARQHYLKILKTWIARQQTYFSFALKLTQVIQGATFVWLLTLQTQIAPVDASMKYGTQEYYNEIR